jgi:transposase InsO family protein
VRFPAQSTISRILLREGLVDPRKRKLRVPPHTAPLAHADRPNSVWCADFKGQFRLGNGRYCYPLTISDAHSRFVIACQGLDGTKSGPATEVFEAAFREFGLPLAIRTDNGTPFVSAQSLRGLSHLSVWWRRLGIVHERIEPGHPEQNGVHERMHRTLKQATTRPAAANMLQQQERFDRFVNEFNHVRPHEALDDNTPASLYRASATPFPDELAAPSYPLHDFDCLVYASGKIHVPSDPHGDVFVGRVLAGQRVGLRELAHAQWLVSFLDLDLGIIEAGKSGLQPLHP